MSGTQILGALMLCAFFVAIIWFIAVYAGRDALIVIGGSLATTGFIVLAVTLMTGDLG